LLVLARVLSIFISVRMQDSSYLLVVFIIVALLPLVLCLFTGRRTFYDIFITFLIFTVFLCVVMAIVATVFGQDVTFLGGIVGVGGLLSSLISLLVAWGIRLFRGNSEEGNDTLLTGYFVLKIALLISIGTILYLTRFGINFLF